MNEPTIDPDRCPHCGVRLLTRHDRRQHLSLQICQHDHPFERLESKLRPEQSLDAHWPPPRHQRNEPDGT